MAKSGVEFRPATSRDAVHLAALLDSASRGLVAWLWTTMCAAGQSVFEVGSQRIKEAKESPSHFSNWIVVMSGDQIAGGFVGYVGRDPYDAPDVSDLPKVYSPMLELETKTVGSWYIMTLSVFPEFRNKGIGTAMLYEAQRMAQLQGCKKLSIMLVSDNIDALRLYKRFGFKEFDRRPFIPFPGSKDKGDWVLLVKDI